MGLARYVCADEMECNMCIFIYIISYYIFKCVLIYSIILCTHISVVDTVLYIVCVIIQPCLAINGRTEGPRSAQYNII